MTYLIKRTANDALMADRLKQYEAVFLNVNYNLHNYLWTISYFDSITQLCTAGLCLKSIYHLISQSTSWQQPSRHRIKFLDLHGEICWDKTVSGTVKLNSSSGAIDCHSRPWDDWLPEYFSLFEHHISYAHKHGHIKREVSVTGVSDS